MGGFGSGRRKYASTPTVEECRHLDIDRLTSFTEHTGRSGTVWWGDCDDPEASLAVFAEGDAGLEDPRPDRLRLKYTITNTRTGEKIERDYPVPLEYIECHFGGYRPWFRCPGVVAGAACTRRVGKLYLPPRQELYLCRECYELGYRSSRTSGNEIERAEQRYRTAFAKADAGERRPHPNDWCSPERPKGMHRDTYETLLADVREAREEWDAAFRRRLSELAEGTNVSVPAAFE